PVGAQVAAQRPVDAGQQGGGGDVCTGQDGRGAGQLVRELRGADAAAADVAGDEQDTSAVAPGSTATTSPEPTVSPPGAGLTTAATSSHPGSSPEFPTRVALLTPSVRASAADVASAISSSEPASAWLAGDRLTSSAPR